ADRAASPIAPPIGVSSVTFVGTDTGWVLGQAGNCATRVPCTSVARPDDAGQTWRSVRAPATAAPGGATQIRFLSRRRRWALGRELWAAHDGGGHGARIPTSGMRVTALEVSGHRAFAVWAQCTATGSVAQCTRFWLYSTPAGRDQWQQVPGAAGLGRPTA